MGPPLPAAGTSGIRQARHASRLPGRNLAHLAGGICRPCQGALACPADPWRKAVREPGGSTFKCSRPPLAPPY
jgi:hypothetical protein